MSAKYKVSKRPDDSGVNGDAGKVLAFRINISKTICKGECMNKGELIDSVAAKSEMSRADATKAVDAVLESVTSTLVESVEHSEGQKSTDIARPH